MAHVFTNPKGHLCEVVTAEDFEKRRALQTLADFCDFAAREPMRAKSLFQTIIKQEPAYPPSHRLFYMAGIILGAVYTCPPENLGRFLNGLKSADTDLFGLPLKQYVGPERLHARMPAP